MTSAVTAREMLDTIATEQDALLAGLGDSDPLGEDRVRSGAEVYQKLCDARDFLIENRAELTESGEITALTQKLMDLTTKMLVEVFKAEEEATADAVETWANERYTGGG